MHKQLTALALTAAAILGTAAAHAGEPQEKQVQQRRGGGHAAPRGHGPAPPPPPPTPPAHRPAALPDPSQTPGDHLKVEDLASCAPGESRSYTTEGGAEVTITRAQEGERYTLRSGEKQIEIGGGAPEELALSTAAG